MATFSTNKKNIEKLCKKIVCKKMTMEKMFAEIYIFKKNFFIIFFFLTPPPPPPHLPAEKQ